MQDRNKTAATAAATGTAAGDTSPAVKERIFSLIKKLENEGATDGRRWLWVWFSGTPHVLLRRVEDGYVLLLWREGVYVEITLDEDFNVISIDVEGP
jgi:hypothetical protein